VAVDDVPCPVPGHAGAVLTIDLGAIASNWREQQRRVGAAVECAAVVKGDAFGCGIEPVAPALRRAGCRSFFVATPSEAFRLQDVVPDAAVAVFNGLMPGAERDYAGAGVVPVLNDRGEVARWRALAAQQGKKLAAFLQVDTGLNRLGIRDGDLQRLLDETDSLSGIDLGCALSHLACSSDGAHPMNAQQLERFHTVLGRLRGAGLSPRASLADSGGIALGPAYHFDLVRPGVSLFGGTTDPQHSQTLLAGLRPVVQLEALILQVKDVAPPETISYGCSFRVERPMKVATAAIGFADGLPRSLGGMGYGLLGGTKAPIIGRLSMDLTLFDVTAAPPEMAQPGRWITLIGPGRRLDDVAVEAGTIADEILTRLGSRYARRYLAA
jgi:alanine racemase